MRPIDADALRNKLCAALEKAKRIDTKEVLYFFMQAIDKFPTAEAEPVRRGAWGKERLGRFQNVNTGKFSTAYKYTCNRCGWSTGEQAIGFHFCPMCAAKMDAGGA